MTKQDVISLSQDIGDIALEIFEQLSLLRPERSFSFVLTEEGKEAIGEAIKISEWGIGGNKPKLKKTALEILNDIDACSAGDPVNVNFTEYELKAMAEVLAVVEKAIEIEE